MPNARTLRGLGMATFELREYIDALGYLMTAEGRPDSIPHHKVMELIERRIRQGEVEVADAPEIAIIEETILSAGGSTMAAAWCTPLLEVLFARGRIWIEGGASASVTWRR